MKLTVQIKTTLRNGFLFILGVIATICVTKMSNLIVPDSPIVVKQYSDTIKIIHDYKFPERLGNDTLRKELELKIRNLELLNNYDKQIKERINSIQSTSVLMPNLILTHNVSNMSAKGYIQERSSSYFSSDCPDLISKFIDIKFNFLYPEITKDIAYLRLNIYKFDNVNSKESRTYISEDFYEVKHDNNFIRINNDLSNGKYEIMYGFMFKKDLNEKYPKFYFKRCVIIKK